MSTDQDSAIPALAATPSLLPVEFDPKASRLLFLTLTEEDYRHASFLDQRLLHKPFARSWIETAALTQDPAVAAAPLALDFVFHIGHVGSTLIARLLGEHERVFALREPAPLRVMAQMAAHEVQGWAGSPDVNDRLLRLFSRVWRPGQRALVKATSFVSEIAPALVAASPGARAIGLAVSPQTYVATILAGENAPKEAEALAPGRLSRLIQRYPSLDAQAHRPKTMPEIVALAWTVEASAVMALAALVPSQCLVMDFDRFLSMPRPSLQGLFRHLGHTVAEDTANALVAGPIMRQYAKAPEHAYDASTRAALILEARTRFGAEIRASMEWINRIARAAPGLAQALTALSAALKTDPP